MSERQIFPLHCAHDRSVISRCPDCEADVAAGHSNGFTPPLDSRPSKEKVTRWLVVAGGDGYETHICEGVEAMERKFLEVHFGPPLLAPEYTRGEIEEMESLLGHLRNENHWTTDSDLGRVSYSIRHEDGCVDVIRLTDESPSHEPPADPVGFVARSKIDGTIFRDFAKPGECHPINDQCEWMPVYARAPSPPECALSVLQSLSSYLGSGGLDCNDPEKLDAKIRAGIDAHIRVALERAAKAIEPAEVTTLYDKDYGTHRDVRQAGTRQLCADTIRGLSLTKCEGQS